MEMIKQDIYYKGTTIRHIDTETLCEAFGCVHFTDERIDRLTNGEDFALVSMGFSACIDRLIDNDGDIEDAGIDIQEWHHYFTRNNDGGFNCHKFNFWSELQ